MPYIKKSPWVIHYDASSCNGCDLEVIAAFSPLYDIERLGVVNTGNPKHADIFLVTGTVNEQNRDVVRNIYEQMPDPKAVVAVGICATSGGIFSGCYNIYGGVEDVVPVDVYVPGCAARPELIIDGIRQAADALDKKQRMLDRAGRSPERLIIKEASFADAAQILAVQKAAFLSEAEIYNDFSMAPLTQTMAELQEDFKVKVFLKAVMDGRMVGSVRAFSQGDCCYVGRLSVDPAWQHQGIGTKLMQAIEKKFPAAKKFQVHAGHKSKRNIYFYRNLGYRIFKSGRAYENSDRIFVFMEKDNTAGRRQP